MSAPLPMPAGLLDNRFSDSSRPPAMAALCRRKPGARHHYLHLLSQPSSKILLPKLDVNIHVIDTLPILASSKRDQHRIMWLCNPGGTSSPRPSPIGFWSGDGSFNCADRRIERAT